MNKGTKDTVNLRGVLSPSENDTSVAVPKRGETVFKSPMKPQGPMRRFKPQKLLEKETAKVALKQAFVMLRPDIQWKNPVMFVVEVGAVLTLLFILQEVLGLEKSQVPITYFIALDAWLFLTVLFANFATALAEARVRHRQIRCDAPARRHRLIA